MNRQELNELEYRVRTGRIAYKELTIAFLQLAETARGTADELEVLTELLEICCQEEEE